MATQAVETADDRYRQAALSRALGGIFSRRLSGTLEAPKVE
jgi:hypothetical protein